MYIYSYIDTIFRSIFVLSLRCLSKLADVEAILLGSTNGQGLGPTVGAWGVSSSYPSIYRWVANGDNNGVRWGINGGN